MYGYSGARTTHSIKKINDQFLKSVFNTVGSECESFSLICGDYNTDIESSDIKSNFIGGGLLDDVVGQFACAVGQVPKPTYSRSKLEPLTNEKPSRLDYVIHNKIDSHKIIRAYTGPDSQRISTHLPV